MRPQGTGRVFLRGGVFALISLVAAALFASEKGPGRVVYEDNHRFFESNDSAAMTEEGVLAWADRWSRQKATRVLLCPNGMRANFDNPEFDPIWAEVDHREPQERWPQNAKKLHDAGIDPYRLWIKRARAEKISPWISMTMNDLSGVEEWTDFRNSTFWTLHPHCWNVGSCERYRMKRPADRALDYGSTPVQKHALVFAAILLDRYDCDGLVIDWSIGGQHLEYGDEQQKADRMTALMAEIRKLTEASAVRRNHPVRLGVRVAASPDASNAAGVFAVEWGLNGLVDLIVPASADGKTKPDLAAWQTALESAPVEVAGE